MKALLEIRRVMATAEPLQPSKEEQEDHEEELKTPTSGLGESAMVAILELQRPESGPLAVLSDAFVRYAQYVQARLNAYV